AGAGAAVGSIADLSVSYRPALLRYQADEAVLLEHRVSATAVLTPRPSLDLSVSADTVLGPDVTAVAVFASALWRLRL
ncbi:hypothetical protein, partial [Haliangium sp.]|uniref:hypothetical protein n=1 Tax=Haliangium sp. TaxID=2663208 RepID=UPI003D11228F